MQAYERADIMNIGGFSDSVFACVSAFVADNNQRFVAKVEAVGLPTKWVSRRSSGRKVLSVPEVFAKKIKNHG